MVNKSTLLLQLSKDVMSVLLDTEVKGYGKIILEENRIDCDCETASVLVRECACLRIILAFHNGANSIFLKRVKKDIMDERTNVLWL